MYRYKKYSCVDIFTLPPCIGCVWAYASLHRSIFPLIVSVRFLLSTYYDGCSTHITLLVLYRVYILNTRAAERFCVFWVFWVKSDLQCKKLIRNNRKHDRHWCFFFGKWGSNIKSLFFKLIFQNSASGTRSGIALIWIPPNLSNKKSALVHVMAWCCQQNITLAA